MLAEHTTPDVISTEAASSTPTVPPYDPCIDNWVNIWLNRPEVQVTLDSSHVIVKYCEVLIDNRATISLQRPAGLCLLANPSEENTTTPYK